MEAEANVGGVNVADTNAAEVLKTKTKVKAKKKIDLSALSDTSDMLLQSAFSIENMTKEQALNAADELVNARGFDDFRLGGVLSVIERHKWADGYESFAAFVEQRYGLKYRKAKYLSHIYKNLVVNQIPWDKVSGIGWTKLKDLAELLTLENVDMWVEKAKNMTVLQLQEAVKAFLVGGEGGGGEGQKPEKLTSNVTTMTFKLHLDQKEIVRNALDKAKADLSTEVDTVALEGICTAYLGGTMTINVAKEGAPLEDVLKNYDAFEVLKVFSELHPEIDLVVKHE